MLLAGTTEASPLKRRVDLTEVDLSGDNCIYIYIYIYMTQCQKVCMLMVAEFDHE